MPKLFPRALVIISFLLISIFNDAHAATLILTPSSGIDATATSSAPLTTSDLGKLVTNDDKRMQTNANWPSGGTYDESRFLEFTFSGQLPASASIQSATLHHDFRRTGSLAGAKFEIGSGLTIPLTLPSTDNLDITESKDITSAITPENINNFPIRFLAYRNPGNTKTSHDWAQITIEYTALGIASDSTEPTPTPTPIATPASDSFGQTASDSVSNDVSTITITRAMPLQNNAIADNTFEHGWRWRFDITAPLHETSISFQFSDWLSGDKTISASQHIRMYSPQSLAQTTPERGVAVTNANQYNLPITINPANDLNSANPGRQFQIIVESRVPVDTADGSYSIHYKIKSSTP